MHLPHGREKREPVAVLPLYESHTMKCIFVAQAALIMKVVRFFCSPFSLHKYTSVRRFLHLLAIFLFALSATIYRVKLDFVSWARQSGKESAQFGEFGRALRDTLSAKDSNIKAIIISALILTHYSPFRITSAYHVTRLLLFS